MNFKLINIIGMIMAILNAIFNAEVPGAKGADKQKIAAKAIAKTFPKLNMEQIIEIINHLVAILNLLGVLKD